MARRRATLAALAVALAAPAADAGATTIRVVASGDLLIHQPLWARALADGGGHYDFRPQLRAIRPIVRAADLALCHAETPLVPGAPSGYPRFRTPPALARAVKWAGYDVCSTASNHSLDAGQGGIGATRASLTRAGLRHTGSFSSARQRRRPVILRARGVRVAFLSFTEMTNGLPLPHPWSVNVARAGRIVRDARRAHRAGADVVIVNLHWGVEYAHAPSAFQRGLARRLARSGAITAVVGQHAHVVQPIRRFGAMPVVFGEGNLLSNQDAGCCPAATQDGILARLTIRVRGGRVRVTRVRPIPVWVRRPDYVALPVRRALRNGWAPRGALLASLRRTRAALAAR